MVKLPHFYLENHCYFITSTTSNKTPIFGNEENALILWNIINNQREREKFYLYGFVIMPEHLHLLIIPRGKNSTSNIMQEIKKGSARLINNLRNKQDKLWMDGYYDHIIRNEDELIRKINYVHYNPIKRGLVENEQKYLFSSANTKYAEFLFQG